VLGAWCVVMSGAYELRGALGRDPAITVVGECELFSFTPSNPWVAVGRRTRAEVQLQVPAYLARHGIDFEPAGAERVEPAHNRVRLRDGRGRGSDPLAVPPGPRRAVAEAPGPGTGGRHPH